MARRWMATAMVLLAVGGCGDEPAAGPVTVPVPATSSAAAVASPAAAQVAAAPTPAEPQADAERSTARFVMVVQRDLPGIALDHRDEELATLAQQACSALAADRSADAVAADVRTFGTDQTSARKLVKLAIDTVCPDQGHRAGEF